MKTKWYDWQVTPYVIGLLLVVVLLSGCRTKYIPIEKVVYQNAIKHDTLHTSDSVFVRDSIYLRQREIRVILTDGMRKPSLRMCIWLR